MITKIVFGGVTLDRLGRFVCVTGNNGVGTTTLLASAYNSLVAHHQQKIVEGAARLEGRAPGGREWYIGGSGLLFAPSAPVDTCMGVFRRADSGARMWGPAGKIELRTPALDWKLSCDLTGVLPDREVISDGAGNVAVTMKGSGQMAALNIVAAARAADVVIIDDLDQHLSPATLRRLVPALRKQLGAQVICSTHSPLLVGLLDPDEVWVLERRGEGAQARIGIARLSDHPQWRDLDDAPAFIREEHIAREWQRALIEPWVCDLPGAGEATN